MKRRTDRKRLTRKLHTVRAEQRRRMHTPLPEQHRWLCSVLRGHYRYYGLPSNWQALDGFYDEVCRGWFRARRRSQRRLTWDRFNQWLAALLFRVPDFTRGRLCWLIGLTSGRAECGKPHARIVGAKLNGLATRPSLKRFTASSEQQREWALSSSSQAVVGW